MIRGFTIGFLALGFIGCAGNRYRGPSLFPDSVLLSAGNLPDWADLKVVVAFERAEGGSFFCPSGTAGERELKDAGRSRTTIVTESGSQHKIPLLYGSFSFCDYRFSYMEIHIREKDDESFSSLLDIFPNDHNTGAPSPSLDKDNIYVSCIANTHKCKTKFGGYRYKFQPGEKAGKIIRIIISE